MGFPGVDISPQGFEMKHVKVEALKEWKPPKNVRAV
jgi:hypothetical protein